MAATLMMTVATLTIVYTVLDAAGLASLQRPYLPNFEGSDPQWTATSSPHVHYEHHDPGPLEMMGQSAPPATTNAPRRQLCQESACPPGLRTRPQQRWHAAPDYRLGDKLQGRCPDGGPGRNGPCKLELPANVGVPPPDHFGKPSDSDLNYQTAKMPLLPN